MSFIESIKSCFSKYVTFKGRAARSEFWFFALFVFLGGLVLQVFMYMSFDTDAMMAAAQNGTFEPGMSFAFPIVPMILIVVFLLVTFLPNLSVMVRRLHDTNRSGWWYWIALIPVIGIFILLYFFVSKGTDGDNDFGPDPLA